MCVFNQPFFSTIHLMSTILQPGSDFDFSPMRLTHPRALQGGGVYLTEVVFGPDSNNDVWIQMPACKTKQGIVASGRKAYCDLLYLSSDTLVVDWLEKIEQHCQRLIFEHREEWFHNPLSLDDIEGAFNSCAKLYKSGKNYAIRLHVRHASGERAPLAFDENKATVDLDDISSEKTIIPMIKIDSIRFSSRSFSLELALQQIMVLEDRQPIRECRIEFKGKATNEHFTTVKEKGDILSDIEGNVQLAVQEAEDLTPQASVSADANENDSVTDDNTTNKAADELVGDDAPVESTRDNAAANEGGDDMVEINDLDVDLGELESVTLRKPNEVYRQIYVAAKTKAKLAKKAALEAYLEARKIKNTYLLDDMESSSDDELGETIGAGE